MIFLSNVKEKIYDWKNRLKDRHMLSLVVTLIVIIVALGLYIYKKQTEYRQASENQYNMAFYELVDYVQNVETYLAKSLISSTPQHGAETLTNVWREANLAQVYLSRLPIESVELENTSKFLNQVSDYSYSLSRKNIYNEKLTQEDLDNLKQLHDYSVQLENTLNQLSNDLNGGRISWGELTKKGTVAFAQQVSNISKDSFSNLEENFHEYSGLIYDGAFSEHMTSQNKKGLTGENIDEETAKNKAKQFIGEDKIKEITSNGKSENTDIIAYDFTVKLKNDKENKAYISISEKGGHVVFMNYNREVKAETISQEKADEFGKKFLEEKGFKNMVETYYLKESGIVTINYAYEQDKVTIYPDLVKLKVALDNGEILGIETKGYLNSHEQRTIGEIKISKEKAKENLNAVLADSKITEQNPLKRDGEGNIIFSGMTINGQTYADKKEAGTALIEAAAKALTGNPNARTETGQYRGFRLEVFFDALSNDIKMDIKGNGIYRITLSSSDTGNLTRIDNAINHIPEKIDEYKSEIEALNTQLENSKAELAKPFLKEQELKTKLARQSELDRQLNLDNKENLLGKDNVKSFELETEADRQKLNSYNSTQKKNSQSYDLEL